MRILHALSETPIGRALVTYFFDLPRWTLANLLLAVALVPALFAALRGTPELIAVFCLPAALVSAGLVNMASRQASGDAPRWRDTLRYPDTYIVAFALWAVGVVLLALLFSNPPDVAFFVLCAVLLALYMIGVFALFLPALLQVKGGLVWRNALLLAVVYPVVGLGLLALLAVAAWAVWVSRGGLLLVTPALWTMIAVFSVHDRINALKQTSQQD